MKILIQKDICKKKKKDICIPKFTAALFTIGEIGMQPKCPSTDGWIKEIYIHIHIHTYIHGVLSNIKERNFAICKSWMDLKGIMLSEISQRKTNTVCYHLYMANPKIHSNIVYNS